MRSCGVPFPKNIQLYVGKLRTDVRTLNSRSTVKRASGRLSETILSRVIEGLLAFGGGEVVGPQNTNGQNAYEAGGPISSTQIPNQETVLT